MEGSRVSIKHMEQWAGFQVLKCSVPLTYVLQVPSILWGKSAYVIANGAF